MADGTDLDAEDEQRAGQARQALCPDTHRLDRSVTRMAASKADSRLQNEQRGADCSLARPATLSVDCNLRICSSVIDSPARRLVDNDVTQLAGVTMRFIEA